MLSLVEHLSGLIFLPRYLTLKGGSQVLGYFSQNERILILIPVKKNGFHPS